MGKITVNIQREDRLRAIVELSTAIRKVAEALTVPIQVTIAGCNIQGGDTGISLDLKEVVDKEMVIEHGTEEE